MVKQCLHILWQISDFTLNFFLASIAKDTFYFGEEKSDIEFYLATRLTNSLTGEIEGRIPDDAYSKLEYRFGIHTLEIGKALEEIVDYFKDNYDIGNQSLFDMLDE